MVIFHSYVKLPEGTSLHIINSYIPGLVIKQFANLKMTTEIVDLPMENGDVP